MIQITSTTDVKETAILSLAVAQYDFRPSEQGQLALSIDYQNKPELVYILQKDVAEGWYRGASAGKVGKLLLKFKDKKNILSGSEIIKNNPNLHPHYKFRFVPSFVCTKCATLQSSLCPTKLFCKSQITVVIFAWRYSIA